VTRSVEIPDEVVEKALSGYCLVPTYGTYRGQFDAMRAALVAARPYLMPTREATAEALERELRRQSADEWYDVPRLSRQLADVLALLSTSGAAENDEAP